MGTAIKTRIVRIGNSQGIRIPKTLLEQTGISTFVEIELEDDHLIIRSASRARMGWDKAFTAMAEHKDDNLLDNVSTTSLWDQTDWEW
ncbi:AbrB/MazE/SpoVT family DNA-binding domain-containing protein [Chroogloeocystis siderophila]|uniref:MazE family transcriptional regulator n=1 Tax=Chroogloeocystis siderophila 5.2 s.c.1 TaxID=247279 RepID=A0A1U7HJF5_9CHRO|nr:AbrB/MazE/SpoVT family DNA-binding domain-containing protein [Chroogloeocystis siderophila]OKH23699.1 MazE family transcriptional regulator [Chroogloeocystis siderophila 5.2 s.c.1]